jgi:hypothetical protein
MKELHFTFLIIIGCAFTATSQLKERINEGIGNNKTIAPAGRKNVYSLPPISRAALEQLNQLEISKVNTLNARLIDIAKEDLARKKVRTWNINPKRPLLSNLRFSYYGWAGGEHYFTIMPLKNPGSNNFVMFPGSLYFENAVAGKEYRLRMNIKIDPQSLRPNERGKVFFGFVPADSYYHEVQQSNHVNDGTEEIVFLFKSEEGGRAIIKISAFMFSGEKMDQDPKPLYISSISIEEL